MTNSLSDHDSELRESVEMSPHFEYRADVYLNGESDNGVAGIIWDVTVTGYSEGHPDETEEQSVPVATAVVYWYKNARDDRNFALDMDSADHPITNLGCDIIQPGPPHDGLPRKDLFPWDGPDDLRDLLFVGDIAVRDIAEGLNVPLNIVQSAITMFGRSAAAVILDPGDDMGAVLVWGALGFEPVGPGSGYMVRRLWE